MKVVRKIFIILIILVIVIGGLSYLDYFLVKTNNELPRLSIKKEDKEKNIVTYNALFYKVWYCKNSGTITIGDYSDPSPVCENDYNFVDDYYTNASSLKISKKNLLLMTDKNIYTKEMIDIMSTEDDVKTAVYVSETYGKTISKNVDSAKGTISGASKEYQIVVFPTFEKDKDTYGWVYDTENEENYYCSIKNSDGEMTYSKYTDGYCKGKFEPLRLEKKWCELYKNTTLVYNEDMIGKLCEE